MSRPEISVMPAFPIRASLLENTIALYALQLANYIIPFLTLPYLIRVLGAQQYGAMAIAYAVIFFMVLFVDAGINSRAVRELSAPGISHERINLIYAATQWLRMALVLCCLATLILLLLFVPAMQDRAALYLASFMLVVGTLCFPTWLFQGLEVMQITTLCSVFGRVLMTACIFLFVRAPEDLLLATLLQCSATAISGLAATYFIFTKLSLTLFMPWQQLQTVIREVFVNSRALWFSEYSTNAVANSGVFILSFFAGEAVVGVYAAIEKISTASLSIFQPLQKALFPRVAAHWRDGDHLDHTVMWTRRLIILGALAALMIYVAAPFGITLLFGADWAVHSGLLRIIAVWLLVAVASSSISQLWLLASGRHGAYAKILVTGAIVHLSLSTVGAAIYGASGILLAMLIAELVRLICCIFTLKFSRKRIMS